MTQITENAVLLNNLHWNWITLRKFWIAQTCLHDILEPIRWRYKFCCEAEKWWVTTTTLLLVEKLSKMNCTHFGQNIHKTNEKWRYLEIFMNKKIRHLEENSWTWKYFKRWSLIYRNIVEEQQETLRPNEIEPCPVGCQLE